MIQPKAGQKNTSFSVLGLGPRQILRSILHKITEVVSLLQIQRRDSPHKMTPGALELLGINQEDMCK